MNAFEDSANLRPSAAEPPKKPGFDPGRPARTAGPESASSWDRASKATDVAAVYLPAPEVDVHPQPAGPPLDSGAPAALGPWTRARNRPVETAIIERYQRGEGTMEETMLEIHQAGISMQRAEAVAQFLWGAQVNAATVSDVNRRIALRISEWRRRPIQGRHLYVFLGAVDLQRRWGGAKQEVRVLVAVGVNLQGFREVLGVADDGGRGGSGWRRLLGDLHARGLDGVRLFVSEADPEIVAATTRIFPASAHQICVWQLQRDLLAQVGSAQVPGASSLLKAIFECETPAAVRHQAAAAATRLREMDLPDVARRLELSLDDALSFLAFPREHWRNLRSNFVLMKVLRQIRERTRLVGAFSDNQSAVLVVSARLRFFADQWSATRRRWDMGGRDGPVVAPTRKRPRANRTDPGRPASRR